MRDNDETVAPESAGAGGPSGEVAHEPAGAALVARPEHVYFVADGEHHIGHYGPCPTVEIMTGVSDYDCLLGRIVRYEGFDEDGSVAPGVYAMTASAYQQGYGPNVGEWESGIDLTPLVEQAKTSIEAGEQRG